MRATSEIDVEGSIPIHTFVLSYAQGYRKIMRAHVD